MRRYGFTAEELEMQTEDHEQELADLEELIFDIPEFPVNGGRRCKSARRGRKKKRKNKSRRRRGVNKGR